jgi:SAM-dependent methyltransferase
MPSRWERSDVLRGREYDERFDALARSGHDVHGEASFVMGFRPATVLDAGCGTGRVAIELDRRGVDVVGVDLDRKMLETACEKAPTIEWYRADLSTLFLPDPDDDSTNRTFDVVVTAGNVMIFLQPGSEADVVWRLAAHVRPGGVLATGFQLAVGRYDVDRYERDCAEAGLVAVARYATWSRDPWSIDSGYVVSVHERPATTVEENEPDSSVEVDGQEPSG